jgi:putative phosphoribosyl transferase
MMENAVDITINDITLKGNLSVPENAQGIVIFSHGSGSSRLSPRNRYVAEKLNVEGFATLLFDLLTADEDLEYMNRFNTDLLTKRLEVVTKWVQDNESTKRLPVGYFGASTGAASALCAAAHLKEQIKTVVSRGGRPDLAEAALQEVESPVLLIVGSNDHIVINLNKDAMQNIRAKKELKIVPNASHLFEEPGTLDEVANLSIEWFKTELV